jgi:chromosome segregation ATPase
MIEPAMYFGIGFLVATLIGVLLIPLVHSRAVRLTMRRLEAATPLSMAEIQADKDQLRAEFAMSTRRLEISVEQMKAKTTSQLAELGKKTDAINRLKVELGEKTATIFSLEAREKAFKDQLRATEEEYAIKTATLREAERALKDKEADLDQLSHEVSERSMTTDSQRVEIISLRTQIDALKSRIGDFERDINSTEDRLERERDQSTNASRELAEARGKVENLSHRVGELEQQLVTQTADATALGRKAEELERRVGEQGRILSERELEIERLRADMDNARKIEGDLRAEIASSGRNHSDSTTNLKAEKQLLEKELAHAQEERSKLQAEIATIKRDTESTWAAERVENALLRERINDVAAEVARLTVVLEGPNSPIEAILAGDTAPAAHEGVNGENGKARSASEGKGNLADRMRALQTRASRVQPAS